MHGNWVDKAALFELLAMALGYPARETAAAVAEGAFAEALAECVAACGLGEELAAAMKLDLAEYAGRSGDEAAVEALWHELRVEYTRMFVGTPEMLVAPFAGIWYAREVGVDPLLFINKESMAVERTMLGCGLVRPEGTNEPLDHIATECEFLNYLCLVRAGAIEAPAVDEGAYETFYGERLAWWKDRFAEAVLAETRGGLLRAGARVLAALPGEPL